MITMEKPFRPRWRHRRTRWAVPTTSIYRVTDRLHEGRTVDVPCHQIVTTVSAWLAELEAHSQLVRCQRSRNSPSLRGCPSRNSSTPSVT
jgi:hypothetical protein